MLLFMARLELSRYSAIHEMPPRPAIPVDREQAHEVLRDIVKERGLPLQDETVALRTRANRSDSRALVNFALTFGNAVTVPANVAFLNRRDFKGREVMKRKFVQKAMNELADQDLLRKSKIGKNAFFEPYDYIDTLALDSAYLTDISLRYPVHLAELFGEAEPDAAHRPSSDGEVRDGLQYTLDRVNSLLYLDCLGQLNDAHIRLDVNQTEMAESLGIKPDQLKRHLRALDAAGAVTYGSVDTKDGSYQAYRPVDLREDTPHSPAGWIRIYARQNGGIVTPKGVAAFYFDGLAEDVPEEERARFMYQVRRSLQHLSSNGEFEKLGPLDDRERSIVRLEPGTFQRSLVGEIAAAYSGMLSATKEAKTHGMLKGHRLTRDWRGITRLLDKVEKDNAFYTRRIEGEK